MQRIGAYLIEFILPWPILRLFVHSVDLAVGTEKYPSFVLAWVGFDTIFLIERIFTNSDNETDYECGHGDDIYQQKSCPDQINDVREIHRSPPVFF
jgi:hypothetical protein